MSVKIKVTLFAEKKKKKMKRTGHPDIQVRRCGLILHPAYEYLGASPDGQVFDPASTNGSHGQLEIKCPFAAYERDLTPEEACELPSFCAALGVNGRPELCEEHPYYYQVQGQLAISEPAWHGVTLFSGQVRCA